MAPINHNPAPGGPGLEPRWTSSAKSGVGTAFDGRSLVWFTVSHGIIDEAYYPRVDQANTRDFGLLITDDGAPDREPFFSEEKRDAGSVVHLLAAGVPGYRLVNSCTRGRYQIEKTIVADPERDVIVQQVRFRPLVGTLENYRVFALLAPHIGNQGFGNSAWCDEYKGIPMLFAQRGDVSLALASSRDWRARSCGYVGVNDGWRQLRDHQHLVEYTEALNGNVALTGEIDLVATARNVGGDRVAEFVLALGFGSGPAEAAQRARMSLASQFDSIAETYVREWRGYHERTLGPEPPRSSLDPDEMRITAEHDLAVGADRVTHNEADAGSGDPRDRTPVELPTSVIDLYYTSAAVLACHEDKRAIGALIASLSIPWGQSKGDHELGGYHLVWPRDLVESAGALMAAGHCNLARRTLRYLMSTQEADGRWPQNMWLDGRAYWQGIQMDETAFPILFAELLRREDELKDIDPWPMVRRAAAFVVRHGPVTPQDRWEEDGGYSPFTLAVEIAALIVAADFADAAGENDTAALLRETADAWNDNVERWTYVAGTEFARLAGVEGYYTRIAPPESADASAGGDSLPAGYVSIRNRPEGSDRARYENLVSPDALALVRLGLRDANDERIVNTVRVIDALLCRQTKTGPVWYRYNNDGYGEHEDGSPFDGVGVGRGWPLLAGERAHYELARSRPDAAVHLLGVMRAQTSDGGMLPEQVWDANDMPDRELLNGRPSGGAMPLVWAHAEYVKLVRSLRDGVVFDMPDRPYDRYVRQKVQASRAIWSAANKVRAMRSGRTLRVQTDRPTLVHWTTDGWSTTHDTAAREAALLNVWIADLETSTFVPGAAVEFTLYYPAEQRWENVNYRVVVTAEKE
jgi:glucoamylase